MSPPSRWSLAAPVLPMLVAALLRGALCGAVVLRSGASGLVAGDTASYLEPGQSLLFHGVFQTAGLPEMDRTPGYPLFLAFVALPGLPAAALAQVALSVLNLWLAVRLAHSAGLSQRGMCVTAWLMALEPLATIFAVRLLSETLFSSFLLIGTERLAQFFNTRSLRVLAASGVALTAAIFVRPVAYLLPFAWTAGVFLWGWRGRKRRALRFLPRSLQRALDSPLIDLPVALRRSLVWKAPALLLLTTTPFLAAWQIRNWKETGFPGFSSIVVRNAYFYSAAEAQARADGVSFAAKQQAFGYPDEAAYRRSHPEQAEWGQAARLQFQQTESRRILAAHAGSVVRTQLEGVAVVAFSPGTADLLQMLGHEAGLAPERVMHAGVLQAAEQIVRSDPQRAILMAFLELWLLGFYLLAVRGLRQQALPRTSKVLLLGTVLYFLLVSGGVQAVGRLRAPVMPLVCVLAGAGLAGREKRAPLQAV